MYRSSESNVVLLVFRSGRIVLTGGRDISCLNAAWRRMKPKLMHYVVKAVASDMSIENIGAGCLPRKGKKERIEGRSKCEARSKSARLLAPVYVTEIENEDECESSSNRRVDGDIPAKRARNRCFRDGSGWVTADAFEAATKPSHERGA